MKLETIKRMVEKFNADLNEYYTTTGETELYEVDTTIIGDTSAITPYEIREFAYGIRVTGNDETFKLRKDSYSWDYESLPNALRYYHRMLKKSWRVWRSENPDAELEKEDEE